MISSILAVILGSVQGLTEFLPVSSSAHLAILPWILGWPDPGLAFDVALHLGTLVALLIYYRREWLTLALSPFAGSRDDRRLLILLIVASAPGAIAGLALEHQAETVFRSPALIAVTLAALGIVLWIVDRTRPQRRTIGEMTIAEALLIGLTQAFAIVPGVSRSGATITMARFLGLRRADAANFSFLMATPIIAGAGLVEARKILHTGIGQPMVLGFVAAAAFGWFAIAALLRFVRTRSYAIFAWYRLGFAALVILIYLARG
jgi:undecaprenyl-diphosphatase